MQIIMTQLQFIVSTKYSYRRKKITLHCNSLHTNYFVLTPQGDFTRFLSGLSSLDHSIHYTFCDVVIIIVVIITVIIIICSDNNNTKKLVVNESRNTLSED